MSVIVISYVIIFINILSTIDAILLLLITMHILGECFYVCCTSFAFGYVFKEVASAFTSTWLYLYLV